MPSELTELFDRMRREPMASPLAAPEVLRRAGTRRRRMRRALVAGLAAAAVGVLAVSLTTILRTPLGLTPPPGIIGTPTTTSREPTPAPTTSPTAIPTSSTVTPTQPSSLIPATAFPNNLVIDGSTGNHTMLPGLCGLVSSDVDSDLVPELTNTTDLLASQWESVIIDVPDPPDQPHPEGAMDVQIMLFADGGADRFVESLREAVAACPTDPDSRWGPSTVTAVVDAPVYGDETFTFIAAAETVDHPETPPYICESLYEVVRVGDAVMAAEVNGWETCHTEPELDRQFRDDAIDAFVAWATSL
jgi:hypothetical protein